MSEREKMVRGELYDPRDVELVALRRRARGLLARINATAGGDEAARAGLMAELFAHIGEGSWIEPPFFCDYGWNIEMGRGVFMNFNCVILDVAPVRIGDRVLFGPSVQVYTASHPLTASGRATLLENARPIAIGDDTWLGGNVTVLPGVTIGAGCVIAAGSVVTRDVPDGMIAAGNPCRVIREAPR